MRKFLIVTTTTTIAAAAVISAAPAIALTGGPARARPSATFSFVNSKIKAGGKPRLTYSTAHLPRKSRIYLQWQVGTARVWQDVERLKMPTGTVTARSVPMGVWTYRIHVVAYSHTVVNSASRQLYAYGTVTYATLCQVGMDGSCQNGTVQIGTTVFTYAELVDGTTTYPTYTEALSFGNTSCSSITLEWAEPEPTSRSGNTSYMEVVQSASPPANGSIGSNTIGALSVALDGGPFIIDVATNDGLGVYMNGSAQCYTPSGER